MQLIFYRAACPFYVLFRTLVLTYVPVAWGHAIMYEKNE